MPSLANLPIPLLRVRMLELKPRHVPGPVNDCRACRSLRRKGSDPELRCPPFLSVLFCHPIGPRWPSGRLCPCRSRVRSRRSCEGGTASARAAGDGSPTPVDSVDQTKVGNAPAQGIAGMTRQRRPAEQCRRWSPCFRRLKRELLLRAGSGRDYSTPPAGTDRLDG